jgi:SPP1 family predicted phage head-tail adaptor
MRPCPPGRRNRRIEIQSYCESGPGQPARTYRTFLKCWAKIEPMNGTERWYASPGQTIATEYLKLSIAYRRGVTTMMRVLKVETGELFEITSVIDLEDRHIDLILLCIKWGRQ